MLARPLGMEDDDRDSSGAHEAGGTVRLIQVAQQANDLQRAAEFYSLLLGVQPAAVYDPPGLGKGVEVVALPHVIFHHHDATLGPAGTDEWMAFIRDSEGNTVGLVSWHPPAVVPDDAPD